MYKVLIAIALALFLSGCEMVPAMVFQYGIFHG